MHPGGADPITNLESLLGSEAPGSVVSAYIFGSAAEARAHRESDVDVGILFDFALTSDRERFEEGLRLRALLGAATGRAPLDLVVLNDAPPTLAARIITTGRQLYCRDPEADHAFRRNAQLRAADLVPFLRRTSAIKREALGR